MEKPDSTDAGLIGLSLMVVMTESYLQYLEETAISIAISLISRTEGNIDRCRE